MWRGTNGGRRIPGPGLPSIFTPAGKALACRGTQPCACLAGSLQDVGAASERNAPGGSRVSEGIWAYIWVLGCAVTFPIPNMQKALPVNPLPNMTGG